MAYQEESGGGFRAWINEGAGKVVVIILVVALVGVAGVYGYHKLFKERGSSGAQKIWKAGQTLKYVCEGCGASGEAKFPYDVAWPAQCPQCAAQKAFPAFKCRGCGKLIKNTGKALVVCPNCGHQHHIAKMPGNIPPPPPLK